MPGSSNLLPTDIKDIKEPCFDTRHPKFRLTLNRIFITGTFSALAISKLSDILYGVPLTLSLLDIIGVILVVIMCVLMYCFESDPPSSLRWLLDTCWDDLYHNMDKSTRQLLGTVSRATALDLMKKLHLIVVGIVILLTLAVAVKSLHDNPGDLLFLIQPALIAPMFLYYKLLARVKCIFNGQHETHTDSSSSRRSLLLMIAAILTDFGVVVSMAMELHHSPDVGYSPLFIAIPLLPVAASLTLSAHGFRCVKSEFPLVPMVIIFYLNALSFGFVAESVTTTITLRWGFSFEFVWSLMRLFVFVPLLMMTSMGLCVHAYIAIDAE